MTFLPVFCPEGDPVALDDTFQYVVLSTLQWKDANLKVMIKAAKQRFAVLALRASIPSRKLNGTPRRGQSVPRPAEDGGAMLTLLRLPF